MICDWIYETPELHISKFNHEVTSIQICLINDYGEEPKCHLHALYVYKDKIFLIILNFIVVQGTMRKGFY